MALLGNVRNVYYILVNKNVNGSNDLEDLSVDVKICKINTTELGNECLNSTHLVHDVDQR